MILLSGSLLWLGSRSTNDSVVIQENWSLWKCDVLVDVKYGGGEDIGEDNDGNEKKKVKCK